MDEIMEKVGIVLVSILGILRVLAFSTIGQKIGVNVIWGIIVKIFQSLPIIEEILNKLIEIVKLSEYRKAVSLVDKYSYTVFMAIENMKKVNELVEGETKFDKFTSIMTGILKNSGIKSDEIINKAIETAKSSVDALHLTTKTSTKPNLLENSINLKYLKNEKEKKDLTDILIPIVAPVIKTGLGLLGIKF